MPWLPRLKVWLLNTTAAPLVQRGEAITANVKALVNAINRAKPMAPRVPSSRRCRWSSTMGPGIKLDPASALNQARRHSVLEPDALAPRLQGPAEEGAAGPQGPELHLSETAGDHLRVDVRGNPPAQTGARVWMLAPSGICTRPNFRGRRTGPHGLRVALTR